ncbi:MAG: hypothetical protein N3G74_01225 [Candidatus Micrarchaeota archaeon]|nr:hypothetical protein [Candidatus Micrarchaeota archaeon]
MRKLTILFVISAMSLVFAQTTEVTQRLIVGLNNICVQLTQILPIIAIVLFVLAAVVYGIGHVFGAEMKSKATGWATSMVVGAVISLLIFLLARPILGVFVPEISTSDFCTERFYPY